MQFTDSFKDLFPHINGPSASTKHKLVLNTKSNRTRKQKQDLRNLSEQVNSKLDSTVKYLNDQDFYKLP